MFFDHSSKLEEYHENIQFHRLKMVLWANFDCCFFGSIFFVIVNDCVFLLIIGRIKSSSQRIRVKDKVESRRKKVWKRVIRFSWNDLLFFFLYQNTCCNYEALLFWFIAFVIDTFVFLASFHERITIGEKITATKHAKKELKTKKRTKRKRVIRRK